MQKIIICLLFCMLLASCFLVSNQIHVEGVVTDALNSSPIASARVSLSGEKNGFYSLSSEKDYDLGGILKIWFQASGYETLVKVISNSTGDHIVNAQLIPMK